MTCRAGFIAAGGLHGEVIAGFDSTTQVIKRCMVK
jgi:hypothetical protein